MTKVSIVIRCYNEEKHIGRLLSGILQQDIQNIEIIVVDSGSQDATVSIASRYPIKLVTISPQEFSFGKALNLGCQEASGDIIAIASAHVYPVYKDWLRQLIAPFQDPDVALVYGKQKGNEITKYSEHQIFAKWFPDISDWNQEHPFCNNANAAIRRNLWQKIPYNETLTGLEDIAWGKIALQRGYKIAYTAQAEIVHVHEETPAKIYNRYRREAIAMKQIFPEEKFNFWDFIRLFLANTISDWYHAAHEQNSVYQFADVFVFRLMQFWGTYRGFTQKGSISRQLKQRLYYPNGLKRPYHKDNVPQKEKQPIDYASLPREFPRKSETAAYH